MILPGEKQELLDRMLEDLKSVDKIRAIVLGGSYATGTATESSDLDIGLYYSEGEPFGIEEIKTIAQKYAGDRHPTVTGFYAWGAWVNGGAWINSNKGRIDLLYKNIDQIRTVIEKARNGIWETDFEQQPPYGFSSLIYLAETHICIPLYDPGGIIERLKAEVRDYPVKLKKMVIQRSLWAAEFTIWHAEYFAGKQDIYNTLGCLTRAVHNLVDALFSLNELYPTGDKRAIDVLEKTRIIPGQLREKIENILCAGKTTMEQHVTLLKSLFTETVALTAGAYKPYFDLSELRT